MFNLKTVLQDAEAVAEAFVLNFAVMYLNKSSGVAGAPAITAGNIGKMAATLAASTVIAGFQAAQVAATPPAPTPAPAQPVAVKTA